MLTKNINFINFNLKKKKNYIKFYLNKILKQNNEVINSLRSSYKNSYKNKIFKVFKKKLDYRLIGIGGSSLGAQAIYDFLKKKIKKNFIFIDNLNAFEKKKNKKKL